MRRPNLDAIRRRAAAATPGPWKTGDRFANGALYYVQSTVQNRLRETRAGMPDPDEVC
jgi:hypothetical protein